MNLSIFSYIDQHSDITDITFRDRKRLGPMDLASHHIMRGKSNISFALRETMAAYVSGLNACSFCLGSHEAVAKEFKVSPELIQALLDDLETAPIPKKEKPLFQYLKKLTLEASKIHEGDAQAVYEAGWTEDDLHQVILIGCLFNFYNRLLDGHGVKGSQGIFKMAGTQLSQKGYKVPWFIGMIKNTIFRMKRKQLDSEI